MNKRIPIRISVCRLCEYYGGKKQFKVSPECIHYEWVKLEAEVTSTKTAVLTENTRCLYKKRHAIVSRLNRI